jgi:hypothetical protein
MVIKNNNADLFMLQEDAQACPCEESCKQKRSTAVNLILARKACTSKDLQSSLNGKLGVCALRSSIEFLSSGKCKLVNVFGLSANQKAPQFGRRGRLFYSKDLPTTFLNTVILDLLAPLQRRILKKFSALNDRIYYFSLYDLRRIIPSSGTEIDYAVGRLVRHGLLTKLSFSDTDFYVEPANILRLTNEQRQAVIETKTEYEAAKAVHELIMNIYPKDTFTDYHGRIRPTNKNILTITGGMSFDLFYQFREPFAGKNYLAVDVYTRFPVSGFTIHSFAKKIEWAKTGTRKNSTNYLKNRTHGMIVFLKATKKAMPTANQLGIKFLRIGDDLRIDYKVIHQEIEKNYDRCSTDDPKSTKQQYPLMIK